MLSESFKKNVGMLTSQMTARRIHLWGWWHTAAETTPKLWRWRPRGVVSWQRLSCLTTVRGSRSKQWRDTEGKSLCAIRQKKWGNPSGQPTSWSP